MQRFSHRCMYACVCVFVKMCSNHWYKTGYYYFSHNNGSIDTTSTPCFTAAALHKLDKQAYTCSYVVPVLTPDHEGQGWKGFWCESTGLQLVFYSTLFRAHVSRMCNYIWNLTVCVSFSWLACHCLLISLTHISNNMFTHRPTFRLTLFIVVFRQSQL